MVKNNLIQATEGQGARTVSQYLGDQKIKANLAKVLGSEKSVQKFTASIMSATSTNLALQDCDYSTIVSAAMLANALELSLSPQLGLAYLVPFEDKKNDRTVATFVLGYKGYIQLAIRSGYYKKINVIAIKEGELKHYDPLTEDLDVELIEDDEQREELPTIGYYAMFEHLNGFKKAIYWSKKKMLIHADKYSPAFHVAAVKGSEPRYDRVSFADYEAGKVGTKDMWKYSSFWYKDFDGMAFKTMLRQLISKWGIMSIEMQSAYEADSDAEKPTFDVFQPQPPITQAKPETASDMQEAFFGDITEENAQPLGD